MNIAITEACPEKNSGIASVAFLTKKYEKTTDSIFPKKEK
jgi:hypothetical protein